MKQLILLQDDRLRQFLQKREQDAAEGKAQDQLGLGTVSMMVPLYCQPLSSYYEDAGLLELMKESVRQLLAIQLESGCISLVNCNIDSPPDTAFQTHHVSITYQIAERSGLASIREVQDGLRTFMERARPCLLNGGIHTPNHRWVMAGALAKLYEIFGDEAFRERAFQFLDEGLDITEYGEWTERSNAYYNGACAIHLYDVGLIFNYEPAFEAIRRNLSMMAYMFHSDNSIVTEYSGRQDLGLVLHLSDWYYVAFHLMAVRDGNPVFAAMAKLADEQAPKGPSTLIYHMLDSESMRLPENTPTLSDQYTVLFGEGNMARVPQNIPYLGKLVRHPHGAPVLRHRRGKLSVTMMSAQPELLFFQYGKARMYGLKLAAGWFGVGGIAFPTIRQLGENRYGMEIELEGCYFNPLPKEYTEGLNGSYVRMPNELRTKTHVQYFPVSLEVTLLDDGVELSLRSVGIPGIYLQTVFMFDAAGEVTGAGLEKASAYTQQLVQGEAVYTLEDECIRISSGAKEHKDFIMRNEKENRDALNVTMNYVTPTEVTIRLQGFDR